MASNSVPTTSRAVGKTIRPYFLSFSKSKRKHWSFWMHVEKWFVLSSPLSLFLLWTFPDSSPAELRFDGI